MAVICGTITSIIGGILVVVISVLGYVLVPGIVENGIIDEVTLIDDSIQFERFLEVPFALNFTVRLWNIVNRDEVLAGAMPIMTEAGPYVYKLYQQRIADQVDEDHITYRRLDHFEFDPIASFPNTEDDLVTIANTAYQAITQVAETSLPGVTTLLNQFLDSVFGDYNSPIATFRVRDILFDGIPICRNPGILALAVCQIIRGMTEDSKNMNLQEDGTILFSLFNYKHANPVDTYVASRGLNDHADLGRIQLFNDMPSLQYWINPEGEIGEGGVCNMINGTDSGIYPPFVTEDTIVYALNPDICRSVELRYQYDLEYEGIPAKRFAANEWYLSNDDGCFCLSVTQGINQENGCLLPGVMELFSCTSAYMVLSYPHFLFADIRYRNGVVGMNPILEEHRIFLDLEPNTGTTLRGLKRAQFNVFLRPVTGIAATQNLETTLTPVFWIEEGMSLPEEFVDEIKSNLLSTLNLLQILIPVLIAVSALILVIGLAVIVFAKMRNSKDQPLTTIDTRPAFTK